jgi:hypothetical protein
MWDGGLSDSASVQNPDGWQWISDFVGARRCILMFDASAEIEIVEVPSGEALENLLANSYHFELYVTDVDASYLICFNHHDMLICCGSARAWLEGLDRNS